MNTFNGESEFTSFLENIPATSKPSAMVHIYGSLYLDAASVVMVDAFQLAGQNYPSVAVAYRMGERMETVRKFFNTLDEAERVAREIKDRVNQGRFPPAISAVRTMSTISEADAKKFAEEFARMPIGTIQPITFTNPNYLHTTDPFLKAASDPEEHVEHDIGGEGKIESGGLFTQIDASADIRPFNNGDFVREKKPDAPRMIVDHIALSGSVQCHWTKPSGLVERKGFDADELVSICDRCNATLATCPCGAKWCLDHQANPLVCPTCGARP